MSVVPFKPLPDSRREACRSAVYAAMRLVGRTQAYRRGDGTYAGVAQAATEVREAMAEHNRLADNLSYSDIVRARMKARAAAALGEP